MEVILPPGIVKYQSGSSAMGRFVDGDHVRFVADKPEKIKGNRKYFSSTVTGVPSSTTGQVDGVPRGLHAFLGPNGTELVGIGTQCNLYIGETAINRITDITPIRASTTINNNPFTMVDTSPIVTVTDTAHGATVDAMVTFSSVTADPIRGITMTGAFRVTSVIDANSYKVLGAANATSSGTGGGATVVAAYKINCGTISETTAYGYGTGVYGAETYGTARTASGISLDYAFWSLDNYGNKLLACRLSHGSVYLYTDGTDTTAQILANAPTDCRYAFVTGERFVTVLRPNMVVAWADQDDATDWTPSAVNTANSRTLVGGSKLIAGTRLQRLQNLIWSDKCLFLHEYTGSAFVYSTMPIGTDCGLAGPGAFCLIDGMAFWMSHAAFHVFSGGAVVAIPNSEDVAGFVFANLNEDHHVKAFATPYPGARTVRFSYPHGHATEPNRYVEVNIDDWTWVLGSTEGDAAGNVGNNLHAGATIQVAAAAHPLRSSYDGFIYEHELEDSVDDDGAALAWFLQSGDFRIPDATNALDIWGWSPDYERITGTHTLTFTGKDRPQSTDEDTAVVELTESTEMADVRMSGRYINFRLEQNEVGGDFRLGVPIVETGVAGARR